MATMPTSFRVTYFQGRGRGEVMRLMLELAGRIYEDRRLDVERWEKMKPKSPFGQLPLLEVDGEMLCQSNAGARFIARTYGYYGSTDWEAAQIDMVVECMDDVIRPLMEMLTNDNEKEKAEQKQELEQESLPISLGYLEKILASNEFGEYFVGKKISLADVHVTHYLSMLDHVTFDLSKFPGLAALKERVENEPLIKKWMSRRPSSKY